MPVGEKFDLQLIISLSHRFFVFLPLAKANKLTKRKKKKERLIEIMLFHLTSA